MPFRSEALAAVPDTRDGLDGSSSHRQKVSPAQPPVSKPRPQLLVAVHPLGVSRCPAPLSAHFLRTGTVDSSDPCIPCTQGPARHAGSTWTLQRQGALTGCQGQPHAGQPVAGCPSLCGTLMAKCLQHTVPQALEAPLRGGKRSQGHVPMGWKTWAHRSASCRINQDHGAAPAAPSQDFGGGHRLTLFEPAIWRLRCKQQLQTELVSL